MVLLAASRQRMASIRAQICDTAIETEHNLTWQSNVPARYLAIRALNRMARNANWSRLLEHQALADYEQSKPNHSHNIRI